MANRQDNAQDFIETGGEPGNRGLSLRGKWTVMNAPALARAVDHALGDGDFFIDATAIERLDTTGARQLARLLEKTGGQAQLTDRQHALLDFMPKSEPHDRPRPPSGFRYRVEQMGRAYADSFQFLYSIVCFLGQVSVRFVLNFRHPRHFRVASIVRHIHEAGLKAVPIVGLLAILMSMVIAYQASLQLNKFGAKIFTIDLTAISLLREMGVLITAIMVAGRSGSAFAAEIGVMKLREEVDALKTIGLDPIEVLVLPRLVALLIAMPLLTFIADIMGLAGGALTSMAILDVPFHQYLQRVQMVGTSTMFLVGMIKAPVFALLIAVIGTYQGMNVSGSAESVGRLTTVAVVQSIFMVIMADALFSVIFAQMGI